MRTIENVVCFQGRAGERASGNIPGALSLAQALSQEWRRPLQLVASPSLPRNDMYSEALREAQSSIGELYAAISAQRMRGQLCVCVLPTDGAAPAVLSAAINGDPEVTVVWFDAHADFNTPESSQSGYLGGMALAASCGLWNYGLPAATKVDRVVLIGARALDRLESESLARHPIRRLPAQGNVASSLSKLPLGRKAYIHLDLDCLEPGFVPSQYEEPLGMMPATVQACIADIASRCDVVGLSISEFYQAHDADIDHEALRTVLEAV